MAMLVALMATAGMDVGAATREPVDAPWFAPAQAPSHTNNNNYTLDLKWIVSPSTSSHGFLRTQFRHSHVHFGGGVTKRDASHFDMLGLSTATIGELAGAMVSEVSAVDHDAAPGSAAAHASGEFLFSLYHMTTYSSHLMLLLNDYFVSSFRSASEFRTPRSIGGHPRSHAGGTSTHTHPRVATCTPSWASIHFPKCSPPLLLPPCRACT